jgi:toxin CptA
MPILPYMKKIFNKNKLNQAIKITLKPLLLLLGLLSSISILSVAAAVVLPISFLLKCLMVVTIVCLTFYYILRDALLLLPRSWKTLEVNSGGELRLTNSSGQQFVPMLDATTFIHPWLVVINLKNPIEGRGLLKVRLPSVVLFLDALYTESASDQHRQLRVWLRWWRHDSLDESSDATIQY